MMLLEAAMFWSQKISLKEPHLLALQIKIMQQKNPKITKKIKRMRRYLLYLKKLNLMLQPNLKIRLKKSLSDME